MNHISTDIYINNLDHLLIKNNLNIYKLWIRFNVSQI